MWDPDGRFVRALVSAAKIARRTIKHRGNVVRAVREEIDTIVESAGTIADPNASGLDKLSAVAEVAIGVGIPGRGKCCFVAGTLVETEDGLRPIEEIEEGDLVWARNTDTGETALKKITELFTRHERVIWEVSLSGENGEAAFFETTDDHPWWIVDEDGPSGHGAPTDGRWVTTEELAPGMAVVSRDADGPDGRMVIDSVTKTDRTDATYNLTVADFHTYFVGEERVLVHNCPTGSYTNTHESGKKYHGKGDANRAAESGDRVGRQNNDPLSSTDTSPASSDRESFKQESRRLEQDGGASSDTNYNKIDSPGTKYRREDGEID